MPYTTTGTQTYTATDIEVVFRGFTADMRMIAASTGALTLATANDYCFDAEHLAKFEYLKLVDVTLLDRYGVELKACTYAPNTAAGGLTASRPGGVLWPNTPNGRVRVILFYTEKWIDLTEEGRKRVGTGLKLKWAPTSEDTSHSTLKRLSGRDYLSSSYGIEREDFSN
jgi:hypothetical protein